MSIVASHQHATRCPFPSDCLDPSQGQRPSHPSERQTPCQGPRAHELLQFHLDKTAQTDAFPPISCLLESRQPMRAIKSPRLATHAVALQKQTRNAAVHLPPPGPFPSHTRTTARENGKRSQFGLFFWSSHPPLFFFARPPVPATGTPRLSPALARSGTDMNSNGQSRYLHLDPTDRCHQRTPGGGIPLEPSHPSCRALAVGGVASLLPDPVSMAPDRRSRPPEGSRDAVCLANLSSQPAEHSPEARFATLDRGRLHAGNLKRKKNS